ncbi:MAG: hypothetical protein V3T70_01220 [Phycisphaerae bacterium]
MTRRLWFAAPAVIAVCAAACRQQASESAAPPAQESATAAPVAEESTPAETERSDESVRTIEFQGFLIDVPASWTHRPPSSDMRAAEFAWPVGEGDESSPEMIVYFFGVGSGGSVEANLTRWRGQFVDEGDPAPGQTDEFETPRGKITLLDKSGVFKQKKSMMSPDFTPRPGWRMLAAVIECDGGPYFFRALGPAESVGAQRDALIAALKSFRPAN